MQQKPALAVFLLLILNLSLTRAERHGVLAPDVDKFPLDEVAPEFQAPPPDERAEQQTVHASVVDPVPSLQLPSERSPAPPAASAPRFKEKREAPPPVQPVSLNLRDETLLRLLPLADSQRASKQSAQLSLCLAQQTLSLYPDVLARGSCDFSSSSLSSLANIAVGTRLNQLPAAFRMEILSDFCAYMLSARMAVLAMSKGKPNDCLSDAAFRAQPQTPPRFAKSNDSKPATAAAVAVASNIHPAPDNGNEDASSSQPTLASGLASMLSRASNNALPTPLPSGSEVDKDKHAVDELVERALLETSDELASNLSLLKRKLASKHKSRDTLQQTESADPATTDAAGAEPSKMKLHGAEPVQKRKQPEQTPTAKKPDTKATPDVAATPSIDETLLKMRFESAIKPLPLLEPVQLPLDISLLEVESSESSTELTLPLYATMVQRGGGLVAGMAAASCPPLVAALSAEFELAPFFKFTTNSFQSTCVVATALPSFKPLDDKFPAGVSLLADLRGTPEANHALDLATALLHLPNSVLTAWRHQRRGDSGSSDDRTCRLPGDTVISAGQLKRMRLQLALDLRSFAHLQLPAFELRAGSAVDACRLVVALQTAVLTLVGDNAASALLARSLQPAVSAAVAAFASLADERHNADKASATAAAGAALDRCENLAIASPLPGPVEFSLPLPPAQPVLRLQADDLYSTCVLSRALTDHFAEAER